MNAIKFRGAFLLLENLFTVMSEFAKHDFCVQYSTCTDNALTMYANHVYRQVSNCVDPVQNNAHLDTYVRTCKN